MQQAISVFDFEEQAVRIVDQDGDAWFVGKDVCRCLEIADHHQAISRLSEDERGRYIVPTPSGTQEAKIVSEPGVYRLIFTSRTEAAERFKRWLAHDVLPALRQTGRYEMPDPANDDAGGSAAPETPAAPWDDLGRDDVRLALTMVRECRIIFGRPAAQALWRRLPLPQPSEAPDESEAVMAGEGSLPAHRQVVEDFLMGAVVRAPGETVMRDTLYAVYVARAGAGAMDRSIFGKCIAALGIRSMRATDAAGRRSWAYRDIRLATDAGTDA